MLKLKKANFELALKQQQVKPTTKKLVLAFIIGSTDVPKLLREYNWKAATHFEMALIIIAYYAYCMKSKDPVLKNFGESARKKSHHSFKLLSYLIEGDGAHVSALMQPYFQIPMNKILETVIPGEENMLERSKIIANFVKQAKKITSWTAEQKNFLVPLINKIKQIEKMFIDKKKEELKEELKTVKSEFTEDKKGAAKNAAKNAVENAPNIMASKQPLLDAINSNDLESVKQIIKRYPQLLSLPLDSYRNIALVRAVTKGHKRIVDLLLDHGADPNVRCYIDMTPLHVAVQSGYEEIVDSLLNHRANINAKTNHSMTPLYFAVTCENERIVNLLIDHNADPNIQDYGGNTPLHVAVQSGYEEIVDSLLNYHRTNPNIRDNIGDTPLHIAALRGYNEIINLLINHGAITTIRNHYNNTYQDLLVLRQENNLPNPHPQRHIHVADFPQDEFRHSLENGETRQCPICFDEYGAEDLCCIFQCEQNSKDYPFGHYFCNKCAKGMLDTTGEDSLCPLCRKGLKPH